MVCFTLLSFGVSFQCICYCASNFVPEKDEEFEEAQKYGWHNDFRLILIQFHLNLIFLDFFLDMFITEITPVTSSSSEIIKPFPTSDEKYINVFFPVSDTKT